jgi:hypothetical protein
LKRGADTFDRQFLDQFAGIAEADSPETRLPDPEFPPDQVVERDSFREDVPAYLSGIDFHSVVPPERLDRLQFEEGRLPFRGDRLGRFAPVISPESSSRDRFDLVPLLRLPAPGRGDLQRDDGSFPHPAILGSTHKRGHYYLNINSDVPFYVLTL